MNFKNFVAVKISSFIQWKWHMVITKFKPLWGCIYICRFMSQFAGILCLVCTGHLHLVDVIKVLGCLCVSFRLKLILHNAVACYWINTYIWALRKHWNEKGNCYMLEKDCDDSIFIRLWKRVCKIWQKCISTEYWMIWEKNIRGILYTWTVWKFFVFIRKTKLLMISRQHTQLEWVGYI